jgi:hypothetical protein
MLWAGLGEGGGGGRAGRAWLLGQHSHLAPHWHSILGLVLGFDDVIPRATPTFLSIAHVQAHSLKNIFFSLARSRSLSF